MINREIAELANIKIEVLALTVDHGTQPMSNDEEPVQLALLFVQTSALTRGRSEDLEQAGWLHRTVPAVDDDLRALNALPAANRIVDRHCVHLEVREHATNLGMIVQAHDRLPLQALHQGRHLLVLLESEVDAVPFGLPIWRIKVEERVGAVVPLHQLVPVHVLDVGARQPQMSRGQVLFDPQQVDRRRGRRRAPGLPLHLAAERMMLQIEEPHGALDVRERVWWRLLMPLED